MIKVRDGYGKLIGSNYNGDIAHVLLSNGGNLQYAVGSTASTLVQRNTSGQIESSVTSTVAPFVISSTKVNTNLNADLLDGFQATGLFQSLTSAADKNLYIKIGNTEKEVSLLYASYLGGVTKEGLFTEFVNVNDSTNPKSIKVTIGGTTKYLKVAYSDLAGKVICNSSTNDVDRPIVVTNKSNEVYYSTKVTLNYSTGNVTAPTFTGNLIGTANKVANNLILKIKSGSTENTDLYTYDGSTAKTLDIKQGSNITLTTAANSLTITASDSKVTQTNTTTNADYRVLFSATADDTTRTEAARKATNLLFNPSSGLLAAGGFVKSGSSDAYVLLGGGGHKALSELGGVSGNYVLKTGDIMTGNLQFTGGDNGRFIVINKADASIQHYATTTSGWSMGSFINDNAGNRLGAIAGAYGTTNTLTYCYYGGTWDNPSLVILPNKNVGINITTPVCTLDINGDTLIRGQIINNSDPGPDDVGVPGAGVYNYSPSMTDWLPNHKSFIGSAYNTQYDSWWNLISVRHRNGYSDGNAYGMYLTANFSQDNNLYWNKQENGSWIGERVLLDSANYGGYIHSNGYTMSQHIIDASGLNQNTWYPVTINVGTERFALIEVVTLWGWAKPSWSTHTSGFYVHKVWYTTGCGWGITNGPRRLIIHSDSLWCNSDPVRGIGQMTESSNEYFYVRGGGKYIVRVSHGCIPYLHTSTYTQYNQSIGPTTSAPAGIGAFASSYSFYAPAFYANSDINLKTNIQTITNSNNIPELKEFDWKKDGSHSYGLIAQELEEMGYSELVELNGEYKTVNYSAALSLIVGKLQVKIKELEKEIENLKNKN